MKVYLNLNSPPLNAVPDSLCPQSQSQVSEKRHSVPWLLCFSVPVSPVLGPQVLLLLVGHRQSLTGPGRQLCVTGKGWNSVPQLNSVLFFFFFSEISSA